MRHRAAQKWRTIAQIPGAKKKEAGAVIRLVTMFIAAATCGCGPDPTNERGDTGRIVADVVKLEDE